MAVLLSRLELTRGNTAGSSEALARANPDRLRPIPLATSEPPKVPEIKTLGDTAVSKQVTGQTGYRRGGIRPRWILAGAGVALLVGVYVLRPTGARPTSPRPEHALPTAPIVAAPPLRPAVPASFEIGLDSVPTGASVFLGEVLIGTTPTTYKTEARSEPLEFTFRAQGFEPERIQAMPAPGLTLHAKFATPVAAKRPSLARRKRAARSTDGPSTDIQTER